MIMYYDDGIPSPIEVRFFEIEHAQERLQVLEAAHDILDHTRSHIDDGMKRLNAMIRSQELTWERIAQEVVEELEKYGIDFWKNDKDVE